MFLDVGRLLCLRNEYLTLIYMMPTEIFTNATESLWFEHHMVPENIEHGIKKNISWMGNYLKLLPIYFYFMASTAKEVLLLHLKLP